MLALLGLGTLAMLLTLVAWRQWPSDAPLARAGAGSHRRVERAVVVVRDESDRDGMRIYIEAKDNIDEVASRAKAAGITLKSEPHDTEWGSRAFDVQEPSGFLLNISSPTPSK